MSSKFVYGLHAVEHGLKTARARLLYLKQGASTGRLLRLKTLAEELGCSVTQVSSQALSELISGDKSHQGAVLEIEGEVNASVSFEQLLAPSDDTKLFLLLDGVTDPGNLGACLRSAASMGVNAVIAPKNNSAPLNADAIKRSSGAASLVPYIQVVNLARCIDQLKAAGVWIVGTVLEDSQPISDIDLNGDIALVMGSEGKGLRDKTIKHCDFLAHIPMNYGDLSLNVSVATGICLYEVQRQRSLGKLSG